MFVEHVILRLYARLIDTLSVPKCPYRGLPCQPNLLLVLESGVQGAAVIFGNGREGCED